MKIKNLNLPLPSVDCLPSINDYFIGAQTAVVQFDPNIPVDFEGCNREHLIENMERCHRLNELHISDGSQFLLRLESGLKRSLRQATRNRRMAVPFLSTSTSQPELQLMLPISLDTDDLRVVDCALVLRLINSNTNNVNDDSAYHVAKEQK